MAAMFVRRNLQFLVAMALLVFPVAIADYCPPEWHESEGHCYKLFTPASKWTQAQQTCETENANLVSIHNAKEAEVVELLRNDQRVSIK